MSLISTPNIYKFIKSRFFTHRPFILYHVITYRCNLRCEMCYVRKRCDNPLKPEEIFKMLDDAKKAGFFIYLITGGEPLLYDDLPKILAYAKTKGFSTYLNTNGVLLKERLHEIAPFIDSFSTSIDGSMHVHDKLRGRKGAYKKTIMGIKKARKLGLKLRVIVTIGPQNLNEMEKIAKLTEKFKIPLVFNARHKEGKIEFNEMELKEFMEKIIILKRKGYIITNSNKGIIYLQDYNIQCVYPKVFIGVRPSGDIFSCTGTVFGNVKSTSFDTVFKSRQFKDFMKEVKNCKKFCKVECMSETDALYNLNPSKIISFLRTGFI